MHKYACLLYPQPFPSDGKLLNVQFYTKYEVPGYIRVAIITFAKGHIQIEYVSSWRNGDLRYTNTLDGNLENGKCKKKIR